MTGTQSYRWSQAGDFNTIPTTLPMTIIRDHASLSDAWEVTRPPYSPTPASSTSMPSLSQAIETFGVTADSPLNSYSTGKHLVAHAIAWQGKRLDYILFRDPHPYPQLPNYPHSSRLAHVCSSQSRFLGHHFRTRTISASQQHCKSSTLTMLALRHPITNCAWHRTDASAVLGDLTSCYRYSRTRAKRHLSLFGLSVGTLLSLQPPLVGSQPGQHHLSY
jgi:sphingomyelin phosphodiesterase 2